MCPREPVLPGPRPLVREHGERLGFARCVCQLREGLLARLVLPSEQEGGVSTGPAQRPGAELRARRAQPFAPRLLSALDQRQDETKSCPRGKRPLAWLS